MIYDCIIIGGGPAGMTAGIYLARANFKTLILEKETIGGQISSATFVENYPGFVKISGSELSSNMYDQAIQAGAEYEIETVVGIHNEKIKKVMTDSGEYQAKTIIIATGSKYKRLGLDVEEKYIGNGVHFCVSCDGAFYKNKVVAVVGGGNTAVTNAISLSELATKVLVIHVLEEFTCEEVLKDKIKTISNVEVMFDSEVVSFNGEENLESITVKTKGKTKEIVVDGLFESVGMDAQTELVEDLLERSETNYIVSDNCLTKIEGIFVAGDCRDKEVRQLTTATADGSISAKHVMEYLRK